MKAADCLSWLVELPMMTPSTVNMLTVTHRDRPAFNTRSHAKRDSPDTTPTPHQHVSPKISSEANSNTQTPYSGQNGSITTNADD